MQTRPMWVWAVILLASTVPAAAAGMVDRFDAGPLDDKLWNDCQVDKALLSFGSEKGRAFLVNRIDRVREDVDMCPAALVAERETDAPLGPSLIASFGRVVLAEAPAEKCPQPERRSGAIIVQRNELRFRKREHSHALEAPHWYSIAFKVEGDGGDTIPVCGSVRWVIAQWKYKDIPPGIDDSPFLAARFDNGVLHITVQDGFCRCMIAKTEGDPDRVSPPFAAASAMGGLHPVRPLVCKRSMTGPDEGKPCEPAHLRLFSSSPIGIPLLPDPRTDWVRLTYHLRVGGAAGALIDIYANGRFIVRAEGRIDDGVPSPNTVKFKFGHYRDKIPIKAKMSVDEICMSETAAACDPTVRKPESGNR
ncbi:MAG: hypothetical protein ACREC6_02965 [Hyphomicrobiaceae bacterium]